jgi:hypothetical protein
MSGNPPGVAQEEKGEGEKIMKLTKAADRTIRHPIRSTILVEIAAALATIVLVLLTNGNSGKAASSLVNGSFERNNLLWRKAR